MLFLFDHLPCGSAPLRHHLAAVPAQLSLAPHADTAVPRGSGKALLAMLSRIALVWHSAPFRGVSLDLGELCKSELHTDILQSGNQMNWKAYPADLGQVAIQCGHHSLGPHHTQGPQIWLPFS